MTVTDEAPGMAARDMLPDGSGRYPGNPAAAAPAGEREAYAPPVSGSDALVAKLSDRIAALARGNPLPRADISFDGGRVDRRVTATLRVTFECRPSSRTYAGTGHPEGSLHCRDEKAMAERLAALARECVSNPANAGEVAELIRKDPVAAFARLEEGFSVGKRVVRCHRHAPCGTCGATGQAKCRACFGRGMVPCGCNDGKVACTASGCRGGVHHFTVRELTRDRQGYEDVQRTQLCATCNGSGRSGHCHRCNGYQSVDCQACGRSGKVDCTDCGTHGWFVVAVSARVTGHPTRTLSFPQGTPPSFASQVQALPLNEITGKHADLKICDVTVRGGAVSATGDCSMPHVTVAAKFGGLLEQRFEAVGKLARVVSMPPFLDTLLRHVDLAITLAVVRDDLAAVAALAGESRLATSALVATAAGRDALAETLKEYGDAVSRPFAARLANNLDRAYDGLGRAAIRRTWLRLGPLALAAAAAIPFQQERGTPGFSWLSLGDAPGGWNAVGIVAGLAPALLVAAIAGGRARRAARAVLGEGARRSPRQGRWVAIGFGLSLAAAFAGQQAGMPPAPSAMGLVPSRVAALRSAPSPAAAVLSPSPLPTRTRPPPETPVRGVTAQARIQRGLQDLAFYRGPVDGRMTHDTAAAVSRLLALVPHDQTWRIAGLGVAGMVQAVLRDEIRLGHLPADGFVTARLSNITRGNLGRDDMARLLGAAGRAASTPGVEVSWSSSDGQRGGRVVASRAGPRCMTFDVEVRLRGTVETTGPETACGPLSTTAWGQP